MDTAASFGMALKRVLSYGDQRRLAKHLAVAETTVSGWVNGHHAPTAETAAEIERVLGLEKGTLTVHLGFLPLGADAPVLQTTEEAVIADEELSARDKRLILELLRRFKSE